MSKLSEVVQFHTVVKAEKDPGSYAQRYRAKCEWFAEMTVMKPVTDDHKKHIEKQLKRTISRHIEDMAYKELREHLLKLERMVRESLIHDRYVANTFSDIHNIMNSIS